MSKYEEWYDYEDYDDEYEDEKNIYELIYYKRGKEKSLDCKDFDDAFFVMKSYNICNRVIVIDRRDKSNKTDEFNKFLKEKGFVFYDEAEKEIPSMILQQLPKETDCYYFTYEEKNFLRISNLNKILTDESGSVLWKYGYFMFATVSKMANGETKLFLFIDRALEDSPVYIIKSYNVREWSTKEKILSNTECFSPSFSTFQKKLVFVPNRDEYDRMINDTVPQKTPEEDQKEKEQKEKEQKEAEERAAEEKLRGEKLDYSIENIDYKGASFELLKFKYHNKEFVYATVELGAKIAEADDIGSDFEKSIIEFLEQEEFKNMKEKIAEVPYWNRFMEYCNEHFIRNDTVFYGSGFFDFMFRHNGVNFYKLKLSYDHMMFGYMLANSDYSEEELMQIANDNRCNEVLDKDSFYKLKEFMDKAHRHAEEFAKFCAENDIPNVIEEHKVERVFDFNDFIDDSYDDEWDEE